jgi:hypothetical protein
MAIHLRVLPKPDGAPFTCAVNQYLNKWPYVERCPNEAVGMLPVEDQEEASKEFSFGGSLICQTHADRVDEYLEEVRSSRTN